MATGRWGRSLGGMMMMMMAAVADEARKDKYGHGNSLSLDKPRFTVRVRHVTTYTRHRRFSSSAILQCPLQS
jgi:hypothetical protein